LVKETGIEVFDTNCTEKYLDLKRMNKRIGYNFSPLTSNLSYALYAAK
jgi:hypothetical protein